MWWEIRTEQRAAAVAGAEAKRAKIKDLVAQGKSLEEIRAGVGDTFPNSQAARFPSFTTVVYQELTKSTSR